MEIEKNKTTIETATGQRLGFTEIIQGNYIESVLQSVADKNGIENIMSCPLNPWKALLQETGFLLWGKDRKALKLDKPTHFHGSINSSNYNIYDLNKLNIICDIYIFLSHKYNKLISILNFGYFLNIDSTLIYNILNADYHTQSLDEFNTRRNEIMQKLSINRHENLKDKCYESNGAIGVIAIGNTEYGWNGNGNGNENGPNNKTLSISTLPQLNAIESH